MAGRPDVPTAILGRLRAVCLALPDAYEESAWVGTRWRVRKKTFAHVFGVSDDEPPANIRDAPMVGDAIVLTFRSDGPELAALVNAGPPFYKPTWHPQVIGLIVEPDVDWTEIEELLTESYCVQAPQKLVARVRRPEDGEPD